MTNRPFLTSTLACLLALVLPSAGCSSTGASEETVEPLRFAALAAPAIGEAEEDDAADGSDEGGEINDEELTREDLLLEVATRLSGQAGQIDAFLVPGPLLRRPDPELHASIAGALGSIAAPVIVGLAPTLDAPLDELLEVLGEGLAGHEGLAAQWGTSTSGWRALSLGPDGAWPEPPVKPGDPEAEDPGESEAEEDKVDALIVVHAAALPELKAARFVVVAGESAKLERVGDRVVLTLPPLHVPPHLYAEGTIDASRVEVTLHALKAGATPPVLAPVKLKAPASSP